VDELVTNLPATLLMALATSKGQARKSLPPLKHSALEQARRHIAANRDRPVRVKDLCRVGHATSETVNSAFLEYYGITANNYLTAVRMNAVRRSLRDNPRRPIAEVAAEWGFWQVDQFIKRYAQQFGEFPSETRAAQIVADSRVH
jgi:AraC family ethanolamine operon transcriptional activator